MERCSDAFRKITCLEDRRESWSQSLGLGLYRLAIIAADDNAGLVHTKASLTGPLPKIGKKQPNRWCWTWKVDQSWIRRCTGSDQKPKLQKKILEEVDCISYIGLRQRNLRKNQEISLKGTWQLKTTSSLPLRCWWNNGDCSNQSSWSKEANHIDKV